MLGFSVSGLLILSENMGSTNVTMEMDVFVITCMFNNHGCVKKKD